MVKSVAYCHYNESILCENIQQVIDYMPLLQWHYDNATACGQKCVSMVAAQTLNSFFAS